MCMGTFWSESLQRLNQCNQIWYWEMTFHYHIIVEHLTKNAKTVKTK